MSPLREAEWTVHGNPLSSFENSFESLIISKLETFFIFNDKYLEVVLKISSLIVKKKPKNNTKSYVPLGKYLFFLIE